MTLDEAFKNYSDDTKFRRKSKVTAFEMHRPERLENYIKSEMDCYPISWLKQLKAWGNEESRTMGYIIPQHMITDANADDWEIVECI